MLFSFAYSPYTAVIGDIKDSKQLKDRREVQLRLSGVLGAVNRAHGGKLASKFMITLGDEFQGLLKDGSAAVWIIDEIEREMYPVRIRFGVGVGEITTGIRFDMPLGADGPAYYHARKMIEELKRSEKKKMESKVNIKISVQDHAEISELMNTIFSLLTTIKEDWTPRRVEIMNAYLKHRGTQEETARILGINQSNVQKALSAANFYTYRNALNAVSNAFPPAEGA